MFDEFLKELQALKEKHGIEIHDASCGCCGYTTLKHQATRTELNICHSQDNELFMETFSS